MQLAEFNRLPVGDVARLLHTCAAIDGWADDVSAQRPYPDRDALLAYADERARDWSPVEVEQALTQHPRIGERSRGTAADADLSAAEQAGVDPDDEHLAARLAVGNQQYEQRFGRVYLIRAAGRSAEQMLDLLEQRLTHDDATEAVVTAAELREIALLRLAGAVT